MVRLPLARSRGRACKRERREQWDAQLFLAFLSRPPTSPPDFEQFVKAVLATFAVFAGFVFSSYFREDLVLAEFKGWLGWVVWFGQWRFWGLFALMALPLRYIMGSAVHLTFMYVPVKTDGQAARSRSESVVLLFKDLVFLVAFGVIAMSIANAAKTDRGSIEVFMQRAMLFVAAEWSLLDAALRGLWARCWPNEGPGYFWLIWSALDLAQFFATWLILAHMQMTNPLRGMVILAAVYAVFLLLDMAALVRTVQVHR